MLGLALLFAPLGRAAAQPAPTGAEGTMITMPTRGAERHGGTVTLGVFAGLMGTYGLIGLGVGFPLLREERQARVDDGGVGCGSCVAIGIGATFTLASTWMFVRVGQRAHDARTFGLMGRDAPVARARVLPSIAIDDHGRAFRLSVGGTF